jgi:diguanylate cyclase (GGDEF)-like protein
MRRLLDLLLTADPVQRVRLAHAGLAMLMLAAGVLAMHYFVATGAAPRRPVAWWTAVSLGGMLVFFALIRSGWSARLAEPTMTVAQIVYALTCGAAAYALLGPARGGVFPLVMVVLMFAMFAATPRQMIGVSAYAVVLYGAVMLAMSAARPQVYPLAIEAGHFLMIATMVPAATVLAARVTRMRERLRLRRNELSVALERIRELATHDERTGLVNQRHMRELIAQEHQRCVRSGQTFCLARLDIDGFADVARAHGPEVTGRMLRCLAQEAVRQVRGADLLAHWDDGRFVLMLPDTRAALARGGVERLVQRLAALEAPAGVGPVAWTLSGGLAEHRAGESVEQTLERAGAALAEARGEGGNRLRLA